MNCKAEQTDLVLSIGTVFGPIVKLVQSIDAVDQNERRRMLARFTSDKQKFVDRVLEFCYREPGSTYKQGFQQVSRIAEAARMLVVATHHQANLLDLLNNAQREIYKIIVSIPVSDSQQIFNAETPFAAHCFFKQQLITTSSQVQWQDRYFDQNIFDRYLAFVPTTVQVTLVTRPKSKCKGKKDEARFDNLVAVSKLFAAERGPTGYRLFTNENFHDRWFRCDDRMYHHGGSISGIGHDSAFTVTTLSDTPDNRKEFDEPLTNGVEMFGPNQSTHL